MKKTIVTRYGDFSGFAGFIDATHNIAAKMDISAKRRKKERGEALRAFEKIPSDIWKRLEDAGIITRDPWKWDKSKRLLGYFAELANEKFKIGTEKKKQLLMFELLFGESDIRGAINDYRKFAFRPPDHEVIDKIFEK